VDTGEARRGTLNAARWSLKSDRANVAVHLDLQEIEDMGFEATPLEPVAEDTVILRVYGMT